MPLIELEKVIKEYWETIKEKYPTLTYEDFEKICKTPFRFVRSEMAKDETPTIHLKYFGKFIVFSSYVRKMIKHNSFLLRTKRIDAETHREIEEELNNKLKKVLDNEKRAKKSYPREDEY